MSVAVPDGAASEAGDRPSPTSGVAPEGGPAPAAPLEITIITGLSGAGRSTAAKCLEDLGWFVVDNLPGPARHDGRPRQP